MISYRNAASIFRLCMDSPFDMLCACPDVAAVGNFRTARQFTSFGQHCCTNLFTAAVHVFPKQI